MKIEHRESGWWITGTPVYFVDGEKLTEYGPYETSKEADNVRRGVQRALDSMDNDHER